MNKNAIQRYAVWARKELIAQVSQRAYQYGIDADGYGDYDALTVAGRTLSNDEKQQRQQLITLIRSKGYTKVMEEVAYTWFNRFIALRFMEVNNYLPTHIRVFSDASGAFKPEILSNALHLDLPGLDMEKVSDLIEENQTEDLYRYLLLIQCNAFNPVMPRMFEPMGSYTELLLPNNILRPDGVLGRLVTDIPQEDWTDQVQIIGWMYQYYNKEEKERVFADLKKNIKVRREDIPAATQLFTPDWIVRYMVENSLGRLWAEGHPKDELKQNWKYYLEEAAQEPAVQAQLENIRAKYQALRPEEIRCIDPCMGSGHILAYLFDVLMQIYTKYGYTSQEAVKSIIERNLYGLDIDGRAEQLAYFTVMMKARQYDRRFLTRKKENGCPDVPQPVVYSTISVPGGDEYGSLLTFDDPGSRPEWVAQTGLFEESEAAWYVKHLLSQKYHVVVTNPPYMGSSNMNSQLATYIKEHYADYKSDYFSAFIAKISQMLLPDGYAGFFTPYVWMFIQSYEKLRHLLCNQKTIETLIQFEYSAFEEATVPVCSFVFRNHHISKKGCYFRLTDFRGGMEVQRQKTLEAIANHDCGYYYETCTDNFAKIPGTPVAYWVGINTFLAFIGNKVSDFFIVRNGISTGDNERYLRLWHELNSMSTVWKPCNKGGQFRKWYGNNEYYVYWKDNGHDIRTALDDKGRIKARLGGIEFSFKEGIEMSRVTSGELGFRFSNAGFIYESSTNDIYETNEDYDLIWALGYFNTRVVSYFLNLMNPTINIMPEDLRKLPFRHISSTSIPQLVKTNIQTSRTDWDSFETSWDFQRHPLVRGVSTVRAAYEAWVRECDERFTKLKANEEELNRIFIDIYGLQDELTPEVEDKDVTVRRADLGRDRVCPGNCVNLQEGVE